MKNISIFIMLITTATLFATEEISTQNIYYLMRDTDRLNFNALIQVQEGDTETEVFGDSSTRFNNYSGSINKTIELESFILSITAELSDYRTDLEDIDIEINSYIIDVIFGLSFTYGNFVFNGELTPGFHSDFNDINSKSYFLSFLAEAGYKINDFMAVTVGVKAYQRDDSIDFIPLAGFYGEIGNLDWEILAPLFAEIEYHFCEKFSIFFEYQGNRNLPVAVEVFGNGSDTGRFTNYYAGIGVRYEVIDNATVFASLGSNFAKEFKGDGDNASANNKDNTGDVAVKVGVEIDFGDANREIAGDDPDRDIAQKNNLFNF